MHYEVDMDNCYAAIIQVFKCQVDETHGFMISTKFPTCSYSLDLCQPWKIKCFKEQKKCNNQPGTDSSPIVLLHLYVAFFVP